MRNLKAMFNLYNKGLTNKGYDYMTNFQIKSSQFYGITKIRKNENT